MCIIVIKPRGVKLPKEKILKNCFENNSDGAGIMFVKEGAVHITKGFMFWEDFRESYRALQFNKEDLFVFHFRFATHGLTNKGQCHPFPVSKRTGELKAVEATSDMAMVHNGILSDIVGPKGLSDTMMFVKGYLAKRTIKETLFNGEGTRKMVALATTGSKLAILNGKGELLITGSSWEKSKGLLYSNDGYKTSTRWALTSYWGGFTQGRNGGHNKSVIETEIEDKDTWQTIGDEERCLYCNYATMTEVYPGIRECSHCGEFERETEAIY